MADRERSGSRSFILAVASTFFFFFFCRCNGSVGVLT